MDKRHAIGRVQRTESDEDDGVSGFPATDADESSCADFSRSTRLVHEGRVRSTLVVPLSGRFAARSRLRSESEATTCGSRPSIVGMARTEESRPAEYL